MTRQSISFAKTFLRRWMDARVKPAHGRLNPTTISDRAADGSRCTATLLLVSLLRMQKIGLKQDLKFATIATILAVYSQLSRLTIMLPTI
jgi:hypothetical protein